MSGYEYEYDRTQLHVPFVPIHFLLPVCAPNGQVMLTFPRCLGPAGVAICGPRGIGYLEGLHLVDCTDCLGLICEDYPLLEEGDSCEY